MTEEVITDCGNCPLWTEMFGCVTNHCIRRENIVIEPTDQDIIDDLRAQIVELKQELYDRVVAEHKMKDVIVRLCSTELYTYLTNKLDTDSMCLLYDHLWELYE